MNKRLGVLAFLLFSTLIVHSQNITLPLWPSGKIPNSIKTKETEHRDSTDVVRISNVQVPDIEVFLPPKKMATGQAVIICPGGGYVRLSYDWEGEIIAKWLSSKGIAGIVLKYRLPSPQTSINPALTPLLDAERAIRIARAYSDRWNIQKNKIGVMGFSAGGHLASMLGTRFSAGNAMSADSIERLSSRPDFMALIYPVITMSKPFMHEGSRNSLIGKTPDAAIAQQYSSELQVTENTPPTFLVHATDDASVPVENSLVMYQALKDKKIPVEMHIYPKGGHGFGMANGKYYLESWTDRCLDWLRSVNQ